jgi:hypothetical protein
MCIGHELVLQLSHVIGLLLQETVKVPVHPEHVASNVEGFCLRLPA